MTIWRPGRGMVKMRTAGERHRARLWVGLLVAVPILVVIILVGCLLFWPSARSDRTFGSFSDLGRSGEASGASGGRDSPAAGETGSQGQSLSELGSVLGPGDAGSRNDPGTLTFVAEHGDGPISEGGPPDPQGNHRPTQVIYGTADARGGSESRPSPASPDARGGLGSIR